MCTWLKYAAMPKHTWTEEEEEEEEEEEQQQQNQKKKKTRERRRRRGLICGLYRGIQCSASLGFLPYLPYKKQAYAWDID